MHIFMAYDSHDHGVYIRRYSCASNTSVSEHITLDSDLRPMIMNYHEIITVFAPCRVGFTLVYIWNVDGICKIMANEG